jgi:hypothetical protein
MNKERSVLFPCSSVATFFSFANPTLLQDCSRSSRSHRGDVLLVLEQHAKRLLNLRCLQLLRAQGGKRRGPVQGLGDARRLGEVRGPEPLHEADDLAGQRMRYTG